MKQIWKTLTCFYLILSLMSGCSEESNNENPLDPDNLIVDINISTEGDGVVELTATADNAVSFEFDMGDNSDLITNTTGEVSYTYEASGIYDVEVRAIGASERYLKKELSVSIEIGGSGSVTTEDGYTTPVSYEGMTLVWNDEFSGSTLNTADWSYEIGNGCPNICGWGNNELEYYRYENTWVEDGTLVIEARKESFQDNQYTSSRIVTSGKQAFKYGRVDIRALLPYGKGIWPALWMLGSNINSVGWPASGEIDIMELVGGGDGYDDTSHGTVHWDQSGHAQYGGSYSLSSGIFNDEYHVFSIIWDETAIKWLVDDQQFNVVDITPSGLSEFHEEFFFIFNVAVGGNWPGSPNTSTVFPQQMKVDYIRVFQED